jgi:hypothetical protein
MTKQVEKVIPIRPMDRVEVEATEKHPGCKKNKIRLVPEHMIPTLVERGMIKDPAKKK